MWTRQCSIEHWRCRWATRPGSRPRSPNGEAEEIASVIAFLLSEDASYMTAAHVIIDYGET